jgi:hypothetical protein
MVTARRASTGFQHLAIRMFRAAGIGSGAGRNGVRVADGQAELADRRGAFCPAAAVPVQAAGHAGLLARLGERVGAVDEECRRSAHSTAGCLVLIIDHVPGDGDVAAALEHLRQALLQQVHMRAAWHSQHYQMHGGLLPQRYARRR